MKSRSKPGTRFFPGLVKWFDYLHFSILSIAFVASTSYANTQQETAGVIAYWLDNEFTESTLSRHQQIEEWQWFAAAAKPFKGMTIYVVSERIATHKYEASVMAKAFFELTGIKVIHEITGENDVVQKIQTQTEMGLNLYDAYINDSDLIGTHFRSGQVIALSDFIQQEAQSFTLPTLDLNDFIGLRFTTGPDNKLYQLPDQQFANLYWFRYDWFSRPQIRQAFKKRYGYELGVPLNWSAYEDIAEFFTVHVRAIDGQRVWGHMDFALIDPSIGWRMTDAWLSMAGMGDKGLPNGYPVDEWGIRMHGCQPVGASVARGGALDGPAAIYAIDKYLSWLNQYAPPEAKTMNSTLSGDWVKHGNIAQQIFWYTAYVAPISQPGLPVNNADGTPKWRLAPSPVGAYWENGMKAGYQDAGAWTLLKSTPLKRRLAAWLYAQFTVAKSNSLKKTLVGLTPIRLSDIQSDSLTKRAPYLGGLVEFYRSPARNIWTPTGINVPDYPRLNALWWKSISTAVTGKNSVSDAMKQLARSMDDAMTDIERTSLSACRPRISEPQPESFWLSLPGSPKKQRNEKPQGRTVSYEEALNMWR